MEYKVRMESESMLEKVFNSFERRGLIRVYQVCTMLRSLSPELVLDDDEVKQRFSEFDTDKDGALDFDSFNELAMQYLINMSRRDSDSFAHKNLIRLNDFQQ